MYIRLGILLISFLLIVGCQNNDDTDHSLPSEEEDNQIINVKNSDPREKKELSNEQIAAHLANVASDVPEVDDAVSVVVGPYAVVGIDVDKDLDRSRVGTIKFSVLEALRDDPYGKTAVVVADGDVNERIRGMADKIRQGHPVQGIVDEIAAIVARYMPDFPIPEEQPEQPDQNKQMLDDGEEDKLDDIENDQSNDHREKRED
ncbi:YhcN/YlaJ family sporulation lipoprotein [Ornithinibacillus halophilus]|uniref:Sporulation lipoprotein, YhcN/YlaJ family n=1 Tax=Ornithinibacillus halophilus TaxID=930117 RepID=A0A1M5C1D2_9BACI|nr:YhcN/YlaJ family sporulation lipoprotein [Ornithinibacillus halophilus]SHF48511.1 sporulation lipoprotein, YhcN/YlaJ family [Ornithinibacillus halophilus]